MKNLQKIKLSLCLFALIIFTSCSSDDDSNSNNTKVPATDHHDNDSSVNNGNGSSSITLGGVDFNTEHRDFSGDPVVTDPKTVHFNLENTYNFPADVFYLRIKNDTLFGVLQIDNFNYKLVVNKLSTNTEISSHDTDFYVDGFDYNGAIITSEGGEDINFYHVNKGIIGDHFFQIQNFKSVKSNTNCYLDENYAFVANGLGLWFFEIHDTKNISKIMDLPGFAEVCYTADEKYLYLTVGTITGDSSLVTIDKSNYTVVDEKDYPNEYFVGLCVDANYLYISEQRNSRVKVLNKHTGHVAGHLNLPGAQRIEVVGNKLYAGTKGDKQLKEYSVSFN